MHTAPIDPRDVRWVIDAPAYRVYFWHLQSDRPISGWVSDEWRITDADISDVLAWADEQADGRRITTWVEVSSGQELGLVRLTGWDPTNDRPAPSWVRR